MKTCARFLHHRLLLHSKIKRELLRNSSGSPRAKDRHCVPLNMGLEVSAVNTGFKLRTSALWGQLLPCGERMELCPWDLQPRLGARHLPVLPALRRKPQWGRPGLWDVPWHSQRLAQAAVRAPGITPVVVMGKSQVRTGDSKSLIPWAALELHGLSAECRNFPPVLLDFFCFCLESSSALQSVDTEVGDLFPEQWQGYYMLLPCTGWGQCSWTAQGVVPISIPRSGSVAFIVSQGSSRIVPLIYQSPS